MVSSVARVPPTRRTPSSSRRSGGAFGVRVSVNPMVASLSAGKLHAFLPPLYPVEETRQPGIASPRQEQGRVCRLIADAPLVVAARYRAALKKEAPSLSLHCHQSNAST